MNPAASASPVACRGVSEQMGNIIIPYGSKILRSLLRRASNTFMNKYSAYIIAGLSVFIGGGSLTAFALFLYAGSLNFVSLGLGKGARLFFDACLSFLFFAQHSVMIRKTSHRYLERFIPEEYFSASYAIASGLILWTVIVFWQESGRAFVQFHGVSLRLMRLVFLAAIAGFIWASRSLKSFDAFGVGQIVNHLHGRKTQQMPFTVHGPYCWVRHPFYFCTLLMIWSCPYITMDRLLFNVLWTAWIVTGAIFEERDLVAAFSEKYVEYQKKVPMLIPYKLRPCRDFDDSGK